ncbi:MAG: TVP38/TMEM64 family protein [Deltaproteobacteria bacterium]|nr:TVP38/TMEM64 family protein [Deltaproteobacteria bacterium]
MEAFRSHAARDRKARWLTPATLGIAALALLVGASLSRDLLEASAQTALLSLGLWGPVLFLAALSVRPLLLLPAQAFAAAAGVVWGGAWGTVLVVAGSVLAMELVTLLGRRLLRTPIRRLAGKRAAALADLAGRRDFVYAVLASLNPLLPTDLCIAVGAAAGGRRHRLVLGTVLGSIPGTVATAYLGRAVVEGKALIIALSAAGLAASVAGGIWFGRSLRRALA